MDTVSIFWESEVKKSPDQEGELKKNLCSKDGEKYQLLTVKKWNKKCSNVKKKKKKQTPVKLSPKKNNVKIIFLIL